MQPQDFAIAHFDAMKRLGEALKKLPAQILEHEYSGESFGSWSVTLRHKGVVARISFDGHDDSLWIKRSTDRKPPYRYGDANAVSLVGAISGLDDAAIEQVCAAILES